MTTRLTLQRTLARRVSPGSGGAPDRWTGITRALRGPRGTGAGAAPEVPGPLG